MYIVLNTFIEPHSLQSQDDVCQALESKCVAEYFQLATSGLTITAHSSARKELRY